MERRVDNVARHDYKSIVGETSLDATIWTKVESAGKER